MFRCHIICWQLAWCWEKRKSFSGIKNCASIAQAQSIELLVPHGEMWPEMQWKTSYINLRRLSVWQDYTTNAAGHRQSRSCQCRWCNMSNVIGHRRWKFLYLTGRCCSSSLLHRFSWSSINSIALGEVTVLRCMWLAPPMGSKRTWKA